MGTCPRSQGFIVGVGFNSAGQHPQTTVQVTRLYRLVDWAGWKENPRSVRFELYARYLACHPGCQVMYLSDIFEIVARG